MNYYYADSLNQTVGPVAEDHLHDLYQDGTITQESYVIEEGSTDWKPYRALMAPVLSQARTIVLPPAPRLRQIEVVSIPQTPSTRDCPFCAEPVALAAKKCKHCGETLDVALRAAEEAKRSHSNQPMVFMNAGGAAIAANQKKSFPHLAHLIITLLTVGMWFPIWFLHYIFRSRNTYA